MTTVTLSIDAQICDHMVWELNQSGFQDTLRAVANTDWDSMSGPYGTATRTYLPEYDHDWPQKYRVSIYPMDMTQLRLSRIQFREDFRIMLTLYRRIDVGEDKNRVTLEGDRVLKLADELRKWFESGFPTSAQVKDGSEVCICARWLSCQRDPIFAMEVSDYHTIFIPMVHNWMLIRNMRHCGQVGSKTIQG